MFDIGWSEILVIMVVILLVVGPKDLPRVVRTFGQWTGKARGYARDFQRTIEEAAEENELAAVRKEIEVANRELADIQRQKVDLDGKVAVDPEPADPQAAQFSGGTTANAIGGSAPASAEAALKPAPSPAPAASASPAPAAPAAGPSAAGTA
ncbi:MAG: twin-arginine translocase subunit TatB [Alphaproteobacteria bacterium]|nr:twin-arginine translocase subunit TatB [Alphaproteobacteria bacterium]